MLDEGSKEEERKEEERKRFAREAGLGEDEFQHLVDGQRSSEDDTQGQQQRQQQRGSQDKQQQQQHGSQDKRSSQGLKESQSRSGSQGQTASQPRRSNSSHQQNGVFAEAGDNQERQERSQSPLKRGGSQQKSDSQSTKSVDGDEYQIDEGTITMFYCFSDFGGFELVSVMVIPKNLRFLEMGNCTSVVLGIGDVAVD